MTRTAIGLVVPILVAVHESLAMYRRVIQQGPVVVVLRYSSLSGRCLDRKVPSRLTLQPQRFSNSLDATHDSPRVTTKGPGFR